MRTGEDRVSQGLDYLLARLGLVEDRIRALVARRRADDPAMDDPFRGLYVNDELVDRLLSGQAHTAVVDDSAAVALEESASLTVAEGNVIRLRRLADVAGLSALDTELLVIALLPDLDSRFERLYGYLNDDVTRRRPSVGLALELAGASSMSSVARGRLMASGPLVDRGLLIVEDPERPFLTRAIRVPDRVAAHLLGDDLPDHRLVPMLEELTAYKSDASADLGRSLAAGVRLIHLREHEAGTGQSIAAAALAAAGRGVVALDLRLLARDADPLGLAVIVGREALLQDAGLVVGPVEVLAEASLESLHRLSRWDVPVVFVGTTTWDPRWSPETPLTVDVPVLGAQDRISLWREHLPADLDPEVVAAHLALGPGQVRNVFKTAAASALLAGTAITTDDLRRGVRAQNAAGLERLARRIEPEVGWDDLVLAPAVRRALQGLAARARHRDTVLTDWRMRRGGGRGRGVTALFAGDSGTGKTMSAEVIATELGLDLYTVNLATVVDKYVGETEKNLERIFSEAGGVNAVLFFDEADAIFGKRSDVRDAHDRYANIESAYLLQRLESFDGLAILATNLRANIDDAFTRRLDAIIDFPGPTPDLRLRLWQQCLAPPLPLGDDLDLSFCAEAFELAGGNIRSASVSAAYLAAESGQPVSMADVIAAVGQEYRKLGRLVLEREFGRYYSLLDALNL
ncbi:ATP-binding protein [Kribbella sp. NPDC006257]|uniref:ATP-binding protein n=1 Tax=Kribbella sp. NPDC006257 TaxID=3156738 RepID=UPI0033B52047